MTGVVFSDLHIFLRRSRAAELMPRIDEAVAAAQTVVLNGDIFDFQLADRSDESATIREALAWLQRLVDRHPGRRFVYVLGNHDIYQPFVEALRDWSEALAGFEVHEHFAVLGRSLFVHGDCANRKMSVADLETYRDGWRARSRKNMVAARLYEAFDRIGLHLLIHRLAFPIEGVTRRILNYLADAAPDLIGRIDDIYFGHTHLPLTNHQLDGIRFHNTGSAMTDMTFNMLTFQYEEM